MGSSPRASAAAAVLAVGSFAAAADAQRLWNLGEVTRAPDRRAVAVEGARVGPRLGLPGDVAPPRLSAEVQVVYDYLRVGMGYLELPLPDGSVIEAENAVFEDRGGGNLMWTGEVPGAGYESVLFTVQDGYLAGWFGEPGGSNYTVYADPDGRGSLALEVGSTGDWCGVRNAPRDDPGDTPDGDAPATPAAADPSSSAVSAASAGRLDILALYTTRAEHRWRSIGGPAVGILQLSDFLNMVFRNGEIPATAHLYSDAVGSVGEPHMDSGLPLPQDRWRAARPTSPDRAPAMAVGGCVESRRGPAPEAVQTRSRALPQGWSRRRGDHTAEPRSESAVRPQRQ